MDQKSKDNKNVDYMSLTTTNKARELIPQGNNDHGLPKSKKKKKTPFMHAIKVAMFMLHRKSGKSKAVQLDAASKLTNLISSVRPLHVERDNNDDNKKSPLQIEVAPCQPWAGEVVEAVDVISPPLSPVHTCYSPSEAGTSVYASAANLLDLDPTGNADDEDEDEDSYFDNKCGDAMIDSKAEQFIAHFYNQMKAQQDAYMVRHNNWANKSSTK